MTRELVPGRWNHDGRAVPDRRNCYMTDEDEKAYADALAQFRGVEEEFSFPALIWWAVVALAAVGSFFAGLLLGSRQ